MAVSIKRCRASPIPPKGEPQCRQISTSSTPHPASVSRRIHHSDQRRAAALARPAKSTDLPAESARETVAYPPFAQPKTGAVEEAAAMRETCTTRASGRALAQADGECAEASR